MRGGVDSARKTADHSQPRVCELIRQFFCRLTPVMGRATRANDADGVMVALLNFAPNVKHDWRGMNFAQRLRIFRRRLRLDGCAEVLDSIQLARKIDNRFPIRNLIDHFLADSFHFSELITFGAENSFRRLKYLKQLPEPDRPHGWEHVERDASFGRVHLNPRQG